MDNNEIFEQIVTSIKKISENDSLNITPETIFDDIDGWDSLNTVDLEMEIENTMKVSFETGEFVEYDTVGELSTALQTKV